jgi:signal peptidase II
MQEERGAATLKRSWIFSISLSIFLLDQLSKYLARSFLSERESYHLINGFFKLTLVKNKGAAFGILPGFQGIFLLASLIVMVIVLFILRRSDSLSFTSSLALSFTLGGALGNLFDRLFFGAVTDFLDFIYWPVFNFADTFLVVGLFLLIVSFLKEAKSVPRSL